MLSRSDPDGCARGEDQLAREIGHAITAQRRYGVDRSDGISEHGRQLGAAERARMGPQQSAEQDALGFLAGQDGRTSGGGAGTTHCMTVVPWRSMSRKRRERSG